jgi:hypothetical protein
MHSKLTSERLCPIRFQRLWGLIERAIPVPVLRYEPLDSWVHEDSKVLLTGDAASPYPLSGMYSSTSALENAEVLGVLFSRIHKPELIPALLAAYDELAPTRFIDIIRRELRQLDEVEQISLRQPGTVSHAVQHGPVDEETKHVQQMEALFEQCGYDNFEAATYDCHEVTTDWLQQWPSLLQNPASPSLDIRQEVVVDEKPCTVVY